MYLTGKLLLATPGMSDTRFDKAVILLCAHDKNGAMGLIINEVIQDIRLPQLLEQLNIISDINVGGSETDMPVYHGGPVDTVRGFLLHSAEYQRKDTIIVDRHVRVTGTLDALESLAKGEGPEKKMFILGYAGWEAGQLEKELKQNSWLVADADSDLIFGSPAAEKWDHAVETLGFHPDRLSTQSGHA